MGFIQANYIDPVSHFLYTYILIYVLLAVGLYYTIRTRFVQFRLFRRMTRRHLLDVAGGARRHGDGIRRGHPRPGIQGQVSRRELPRRACLLHRARPAVPARRRAVRALLIFTFGIAFNMVQANTIGDVLKSAHTVSERWTAVVLMVIAAPVLFGGVRRVAKLSGYLLPVMALGYILIALIVICMHLGQLPHTLNVIVQSAFGIGPAAAGLAGGMSAALLNGVKRGLFSNEAGMGSAPNAAAPPPPTIPPSRA